MRFALIDGAKAQFPVHRLCRVLGVSQRSHGRLASDCFLRVRLLPHHSGGDHALKTHPGLRRPLSAPVLARSLCRWNCHAEPG